MKIAFVYDRVNKIGGAEQVLLALHQIWPQAPLYTSVYNPSTSPWAEDFKVKTSFINYFPLAKTHHELYPLLTPIAFESFDFSNFDVVISITSAEAKAIITSPKTFHLCYCLTPTRYLWSHSAEYLKSPGLGIFNNLAKKVFNSTYPYLQKIDLINSSRPDAYFAISGQVQKRINKYYKKDSIVIYPPVDTAIFKSLPSQDYFLLVSRLVPYKKIHLAIKAFNQLKAKLIIVGNGRESQNLKKVAGHTITFTGQVSLQRLINLYSRAKALIMPQEEDFGIVAIEAMSAGKPVIAYAKGGALDTVIDHQTGILFNSQTVDSLVQAVKQFSSCSWDKKLIISQAKKFDIKLFRQTFKSLTEAQWQQHLTNP